MVQFVGFAQINEWIGIAILSTFITCYASICHVQQVYVLGYVLEKMLGLHNVPQSHRILFRHTK